MIKTMTAMLSSLALPAMAMQETNERPELAIGTMLGSLILVLACIFLFAFLMKKTNLLRRNGYQDNIKIVATQPLTNKSRVQIIEVHGKQYLLGVSEQSVNLLKELEDVPIYEHQEADSQSSPTLASAFATVLSKAGKKDNE